jgi:maltoporin
MKARYAILALAAMFVAVNASAVDLHGYFRQSVGGNAKGGDQYKMDNSAPGGTGAPGHLRLGNEDNWSEFEFVQQILKDKNGVEWTAGFMLDWSGNNFSGNDTLNFNIEQEYIRAMFPQLKGATVWAGQRFYHRYANDIFDYFYVNESRSGAGVEDMDVGFGKFSVAVFKDQPKSVTTPAAPANPLNDTGRGVGYWYGDIRLEGIPVNPGGSLAVGALPMFRTWNKDLVGADKPDKTQSFSPFLFVRHSQSGILNGGNNVAVTYKTGCWIDRDCQEDRRLLTVSEDLLLQPTNQFSIVLAGMYTNSQRNVAGEKVTNQGYAIGTRPVFKLADHFAIQGDLGYFYNKDDKPSGTKANTMVKGTIAPTITPFTDGFAWGVRPEIRFYVTYASWNKEQNPFGTLMPVGTASNGTMYGMTVETWF